MRNHRPRGSLALVLAVTLCVTVSEAEPPPRPAAGGPAPFQKTIDFSAENLPWEKVFERLTHATGIPVVANSYPTGRFTFQGPSGRKPTLNETVAILNAGLLFLRETKYLLLVDEKMFVLVGADEKLDGGPIRSVPVADLAKHHKTDLLRCRWVIKNQVALDLANELKPFLGPFGRIDVLPRTNTILITDIAANLRRLDKIITDVPCGKSNGDLDNYSHQCKYITPRDAEKRLIELLGDPKVLFPTATVDDPKRGLAPGVQAFFFTVDPLAEQVIVSGSAAKLKQVKDLLRRLDVPPAAALPQEDKGPFSYKRIDVPAGNAAVLAKNVALQLKGSPVSIEASGLTQILVYASAADHIRIARTLGERCNEIVVVRIGLGALDAAAVASVLTKLPAYARGGKPFIDIDAEGNSVVLRGTPAQLAAAVAVLQGLRFTEPLVTGRVRLGK